MKQWGEKLTSVLEKGGREVERAGRKKKVGAKGREEKGNDVRREGGRGNKGGMGSGQVEEEGKVMSRGGRY